MLIEAMGFLLGLGFFPCLLFGVIMFISFLTCDYIEKFVMKTFCSFKNRRRRFREKGIESKRKSFKGGKKSGSDDGGTGGNSKRQQKLMALYEQPGSSAPRSQATTIQVMPEAESSTTPMYDDPPPAYNECVPNRVSSDACKAKID